MADWNKPSTASTKTNFPTEIRNALASAIKLDPTADSNIPTGALYYNQTTKRLQKYNGASWVDVAIGTSILATFGTSALADSVTSASIYCDPFIGSSIGGVGYITGKTLPTKTYITGVQAERSDSGSGFTSGTMTLVIKLTGSTIHTLTLNTTAPTGYADITPTESSGGILTCEATQSSGAAACDTLRVTVFGSLIAD